VTRIGIIGVGLIGGSLGLALRAARPDLEVVGITRNREEAEDAVRRKVVSEATWELAAAASCELLVIAVPIAAMPRTLQQLGTELPPSTLITDVASVKAPVLTWAEHALTERTRFLGGHPMAGRTTSGIGSAEESLFHGAAWVFTPYPNQPLDRFQPWIDLVVELGCRPTFMAAEAHDQSVALTSHLAFTISTAFTAAVRTAPQSAQALAIAGPGFRDMSRLAQGDPGLYHAIATTNRDHLLDAVDRFSGELAALRRQITEGTAWSANA
jgi:prephenate dehydrogenase